MKKTSIEKIIKMVKDFGKVIEITMLSGTTLEIFDVNLCDFLDDDTLKVECKDGVKWLSIEKIESIHYII